MHPETKVPVVLTVGQWETVLKALDQLPRRLAQPVWQSIVDQVTDTNKAEVDQLPLNL